MEHWGSCCCCRKCPNCHDYMRLFYIISRLIRLFFQLYALFHNQKSHSGLEFIAESMQITGQSHHPSRKNRVRSIQQRRRLYHQRPRTCLLPQQGRHQQHRPPLGTHDGYRKANRHAWQDETDRLGYQGFGQFSSSRPTTRGLQVQVLDEPAIMRIISITDIIHIICIMYIIRIIGLTISAWVSV